MPETADDRRANQPERRRASRGGRRLEDDPGWQAFKASISHKIETLIRRYYNDSIAEAARRSGVAESSIQDHLKMRSDPSASVIYRLAKHAGQRPYLFLEVGPDEPIGSDFLQTR